MGEIRVTIHLTDEYRGRIAALRRDDRLRKSRSWTDLVQTVDGRVEIKLARDAIILGYTGPKGAARESCTYDGVLSVIELRDGILLQLSHKRLLFLPVTEDPAANRRLVAAMHTLSQRCRYHFQEGRLRLPGVCLSEKLGYHTRPRQGYPVHGSGVRGAIIALICFCLIFGTINVTMPLRHRQIELAEAVAYSGRMDSCRSVYSRSGTSYIDIRFLDGRAYMVDRPCTGHGLEERLEALPWGTRMDLLLHPDSSGVLRIEVEEEVLLDFEYASQQLWNNAVAFACLGVVVYAIGAFLLVALLRGKV